MASDADTGGLVFRPMDQYVVKPLFGDGPVHWYTPTNVTLWLALAAFATIALMVLATRPRAIIPNRAQSMAELLYGMIHKMIEDVTGKEALKYLPHIMTLTCFILFANTLALLPKSFAVTSHIAVTAVLALLVFFGVTILGFVRNGVGFLGLFWVSSAPLAIRPVLALIEVISYCIRPVSHSVRLAGTMMAGHAVVKVFAAFAAIIWVAPLSVLATTAIFGLEALVAIVQTYVFIILTCVYLKDAMSPGH